MAISPGSAAAACKPTPNARELTSGVRVAPALTPELGKGLLIVVAMSSAPRVSVSWTIDEFGNEIPGTRIPTDEYVADQRSDTPKFPPPDTFYLGELPPIVKPTARAMSDSSD